MLLKDEDKQDQEITLEVSAEFGKIYFRGVMGMDAKLQGPVEGGRGGSTCRKSFKKIDREGAERLDSSWTGTWG